MSGQDYGTVMVSRSIFGDRRNPRHRRNKQILEVLLEKESTVNHLYRFKLNPSTDPDLTETRPFPKCCKTCLPEADIGIMEDAKHLGLIDCFTPPTTSSYNSLMTRMFPVYSHYSKCIGSSEMHKLPSWKDMEEDPNLLQLFHFAGDNPVAVQETKQNVLAVLFHLQVANVWNAFRSLFVRFSAWLCRKYLSVNFESVLVHGGQIELLKDVHTKKLPIIYIATYRSNFDKTLILWTLAHHGLPTPLFICGHKEKIKFLKYFGGIAAALKVEADPQSEKKYSSAVAVYFRHLLKQGNSILLHLESGRSRSGRPTPNIYGTELLKIIYDEYKRNKIEDAYFVPVSVSYELVPDVDDVFGVSKSVKGGVLSSIRAYLYDLIFPNPLKGRVKIDYAQPTSFRELHNSFNKNVKVQGLVAIEGEDTYFRSRNCSFLRWNSNESLNSISSLYGELAPLYPCDNETDEAVLLDVMNLHFLHDAGKCESIMSTHLLAFLLQKKFRDGVYLNELLDEMRWLVGYFRSKRRDFGFYVKDNDMESIAFRAATLLDDCVNVTWNEDKQTFKFDRRQDQISVQKLEYYANYILPEFMLEAVISTAIFALRGSSLKILRGFDKEVTIRDEEFVSQCRRVYEVIADSFFLHEPCLSAESGIRKEVSHMVDSGLLTLVMSDPKRYKWEDEDDDDYYGGMDDPVDNSHKFVDQDFAFFPESIKITTTKSVINQLHFLRSLLMPFFEIFSDLTTHLEVLTEKDDKKMEVVELEKYLLMRLKEQFDGKLSHCRELCTRHLVKIFLITCEDHAILETEAEPVTMVCYYKVLKNKMELESQANEISSYVTS